ncbi:hypothetical protein CO054_01350 [Candidatus Shapirobacteria bacterium CG_4_9_14_0_2_um_filter_39_11]|uniref:Type II toxin-antitoxin system RelE/ParE family toxin n=1 Tax=Candidatus Shapirobacteria bacterium CG_4_9_14_0_2_um_filter_39_11 TaxID=1974478 RepID=A0A2M8ESW8_9BACT|nr:MAG: hypothetical protein CO054_01350 [Candidatus Shapirobacteria bacterium CG_4_9_14_0_2_um_filter_39_11]
MKVVFSPLAEKQLKKLPKIAQFLVGKKVRQIRDQNIVTSVEILSGYRGMYRIRIGDYRLIFQKHFEKIYFVLIAYRKEVYKLLARI